jgi:hypothetical protein
MGLFSFGKKAETILVVVTYEGPGRLRLNGLRGATGPKKKSALAHDRTVCWVEFDSAGVPRDQGLGRAAQQAGSADRIVRDLPRNATCQAVIARLRQGEESVGKWLQVGEPAAGRS